MLKYYFTYFYLFILSTKVTFLLYKDGQENLTNDKYISLMQWLITLSMKTYNVIMHNDDLLSIFPYKKLITTSNLSSKTSHILFFFLRLVYKTLISMKKT